MKVSDYIAEFIAAQGVKHVFGITGAHDMHLVDSIVNNPKLSFVATGHEQGAAFAADAYARIKGFGVAVSTSGPGAVNLVSGVASAYFDSIPALFLTGQVVSKDIRPDNRVRQIGFQETDMCAVLSPICKGSVRVVNPLLIRNQLEWAFWWAKYGRPGPVHLDIPDDMQRAEIDPDKLDGFNEPPIPKSVASVYDIASLLQQAKRPVVVLGQGVHSAHAEDAIREFIDRLGFPVMLTWGGLDLLPYSHQLNCGGFGVCGPYAGNWAVQHADLVLCLGTRLDAHMTGNDPMTFAPKAKKIFLDIDQAELDKYLWPDALKIETDLSDASLDGQFASTAERTSWLGNIKRLQAEHLPGKQALDGTNPYDVILALSEQAGPGDIIVTDAGATLSWVMQTWRVKQGQRVISSFNHSPMGWAIPAAFGAACAQHKGRVICITGDGSFQMNPQELAVIRKHGLNVKIFVMNNQGYGIIRQTQDTWLEGRHAASSAHDLALVDVVAIARAYGIRVPQNETLESILKHEGPSVMNVQIDPKAKIVPKVGKGKSISDLEPEAIV